MEFKLAIKDAYYTIDHITTNLVRGRLNEQVSRHRHAVFHILYILEGKGKVTIDRMTTVAEPGTLYVISPNEPHSFFFGDGEALTNLECTFRLLNEQGDAAEVPFFDMHSDTLQKTDWTQPFAVPSRLQPFLLEGFNRILDLNDNSLLRDHFGCMVADLITRVEKVILGAVHAVKAGEPALEQIANIKQFLFANRSRTVTLGEIAQFAHLSPNYLCRLFKEHTGETPMGYLQRVRMREAEKLLSFTDLPIYMIAEKLGYEEPSYFARVFRSTYGEAPQEYRKKLLLGNRIN